MSDPTGRIDPTAIASLAIAVIGAIAWLFLGGPVALFAAAVALVFGFLALHRIRRSGHNCRWLAIIGIGVNAALILLRIVAIARDVTYPVQLQP